MQDDGNPVPPGRQDRRHADVPAHPHHRPSSVDEGPAPANRAEGDERRPDRVNRQAADERPGRHGVELEPPGRDQAGLEPTFGPDETH